MHESLDSREEAKKSSDRAFGIFFTLIFLAVGVWEVSSGISAGWFFLAGFAIFFIITLARPSILGLLNRAWMKLGVLLGRVGNPLLLGIVFFLVIFPMTVFRKLSSKDSLHLEFESGLESYWIDRKPPGPKPGFMTKQF